MSTPHNRLADETSLYLRQHDTNPVDWHPWDEQAHKLAIEQDKPILLSIGYSSCHWRHVMAHESFEDKNTAAIMNRHFVNIKVDREAMQDWRQRLARRYLPKLTCFAIPAQVQPSGLLQHKLPHGEICAYICDGFSCQPPVSEVDAFERAIRQRADKAEAET